MTDNRGGGFFVAFLGLVAVIAVEEIFFKNKPQNKVPQETPQPVPAPTPSVLDTEEDEVDINDLCVECGKPLDGHGLSLNFTTRQVHPWCD